MISRIFFPSCWFSMRTRCWRVLEVVLLRYSVYGHLEMLHTLNLIIISCPLALSLATKQKNINRYVMKTISKNLAKKNKKQNKKLGLLALENFWKENIQTSVVKSARTCSLWFQAPKEMCNACFKQYNKYKTRRSSKKQTSKSKCYHEGDVYSLRTSFF